VPPRPGDGASGRAVARFATRPFDAARLGLTALLLVLFAQGPGLSGLVEQWWLVLVGLGGALVANSTGIGGGVVFVPAFDVLALPEDRIVGTSLLIQCFGMSMGALTYLSRGNIPALPRLEDGGTARLSSAGIVLAVLPAALVGYWLATLGGFRPDWPLALIFKVLSLGLLAALLATQFARVLTHRPLNMGTDGAMLCLVGLIGGAFVGWISIGVGELLAIYLMLRGLRAVEAVGLAVIVTALCVVLARIGLPGSQGVEVDVALLVAPGALLGGFLAPFLLDYVGETRVKWFCAFWIVVSPMFM